MESFAYCVCDTLGRDTESATVPYLASGAETAELEVVEQTAKLTSPAGPRMRSRRRESRRSAVTVVVGLSYGEVPHSHANACSHMMAESSTTCGEDRAVVVDAGALDPRGWWHALCAREPRARSGTPPAPGAGRPNGDLRCHMSCWSPKRTVWSVSSSPNMCRAVFSAFCGRTSYVPAECQLETTAAVKTAGLLARLRGQRSRVIDASA